MDRVDKETRSRVMSSIRSKNTRLEQQLVDILAQGGLTNYARYAEGLPGTPDVAFIKNKVAVFLDSCFWHGCPRHLRRPNSNQSYWEAKIERNIKRDQRQRAALRRIGWSGLRVWEHDLKNPARIIAKIERGLMKRP